MGEEKKENKRKEDEALMLPHPSHRLTVQLRALTG
jgi:hypothetical protein